MVVTRRILCFTACLCMIGTWGCHEGRDLFDRPYQPTQLRLDKDWSFTRTTWRTNAFQSYKILKRDPFRAPTQDVEPNQKVTPFPMKHCIQQSSRLTHTGKPLPAVQRYSLDQLRVVAVMTSTANPTALVEDPQNGGHVVRHGTTIGKGCGRVTRLTTKGIQITEVVYTVSGVREERRIWLRLRKRASYKHASIDRSMDA